MKVEFTEEEVSLLDDIILNELHICDSKTHTGTVDELRKILKEYDILQSIHDKLNNNWE